MALHAQPRSHASRQRADQQPAGGRGGARPSLPAVPAVAGGGDARAAPRLSRLWPERLRAVCRGRRLWPADAVAVDPRRLFPGRGGRLQ